MEKELLNECKLKFAEIITHLKQDIKNIHAGHATTDFLDIVYVDAYDNGKMKISSLGTVNVRDNRTLTVQVWDNSIVAAVAKAITDANLNVLVKKEKDLIIVVLPTITQEFRKSILKKLSELMNKKKNVLQDVRRYFREKADKEIKPKFGEDSHKRFLQKIEEIKDETAKEMQSIFTIKEKNIMTV